MGKSSGGVRSLGSRETAKRNRKNDFNTLLLSGKYNPEKSYFDEKSGGYYLTEKSSRNHLKEENEVAEFLSKKGYKVLKANGVLKKF